MARWRRRARRKARPCREAASEAADAEELNAASLAELGPDENRRAVRPPREEGSVQALAEDRPDDF